jgi:hypothetical protein
VALGARGKALTGQAAGQRDQLALPVGRLELHRKASLRWPQPVPLNHRVSDNIKPGAAAPQPAGDRLTVAGLVPDPARP